MALTPSSRKRRIVNITLYLDIKNEQDRLKKCEGIQAFLQVLLNLGGIASYLGKPGSNAGEDPIKTELNLYTPYKEENDGNHQG